MSRNCSCQPQQPQQKTNDSRHKSKNMIPMLVPEPKYFFTLYSLERRSILQPLYLYTLITYLDLLEKYRQNNRSNILLFYRTFSMQSIDRRIDTNVDHNSSMGFEEKLEKICSFKGNDGNHGYRNQLTGEDIHLNGEEIDQIINVIDDRLEQIQMTNIYNDCSMRTNAIVEQKNLHRLENINSLPNIIQTEAEIIDLTYRQQTHQTHQTHQPSNPMTDNNKNENMQPSLICMRCASHIF